MFDFKSIIIPRLLSLPHHLDCPIFPSPPLSLPPPKCLSFPAPHRKTNQVVGHACNVSLLLFSSSYVCLVFLSFFVCLVSQFFLCLVFIFFFSFFFSSALCLVCVCGFFSSLCPMVFFSHSKSHLFFLINRKPKH